MEPFINKTQMEIRNQNLESGFSLIEAVCAIAFLTIGLLATVAAITSAIRFGRINSSMSEAKTIMLGQIEEIHSLRDSRRLRFRQIANTANVNNVGAAVSFSGFPVTFVPVTTDPGVDGVSGTADDNLGTARAGFARQVLITDVTSDMRSIVVNVQYPGPDGQIYTMSCTSFLNNDLRQ